MKKLSNNNGVIKSSTLAGQRELLREYRNKTNEIIDAIEELQKIVKEYKKAVTTIEIPYTAMRSTGEGETYSLSEKMGLPNRGYVRMPVKPEYCTCNKVIGKTKDGNIYETCICNKPIKQQKYCVCKEPRIGKANTDLGRYCFGCDKPIKPQEDVKEKLMDYLKKINNPYSEESFASISEQADKILAIVKG